LVGSPFFFKNFAISLGHFDIYGCLWALVALLIPVGALYPLVIAVGCVGLILMHHLHFLLYIPTFGFIVFVRYAAWPGFSAGKVIYGLVLVFLVSGAFVAAAHFWAHAGAAGNVSGLYTRPRVGSDRFGERVEWYSSVGQ
jgi:hypothetical protein